MASAATLDISLDQPLPQNPEAERSVLGSILIDNSAFYRVAATIAAEDFFKDVGIAAGFWFVSLFVLGGTALALHANRRGDELGSMLPQTGLESLLWVMTAVTAGICEEIIFRGYFQKQLVAWTNNVSAGVLLTAIIFGSVHLYQGWKSAVVILVFGLLFGMLAEWRKSLRPGMMAHAWQDTIAGLLAPMLLRALKNVPK